MRLLRSSCFLGISCLASSLSAQSHWALVDHPLVGHASPALAYDEARGRFVMFTGAGYRRPARPATWEWSGAAWVRRLPAVEPWSVGEEQAMFYVPSRRTVVLVLWAPSMSKIEVWEWDGAAETWQQLAVTGPPGRSGAAVALDRRRNRLVLFGGFFTSDTWEWDFTAAQWSRVPSSALQPGRYAATYDETSAVVLAVGDAGTWSWDGMSWTRLGEALSKPKVLVYDSARGKTLLLARSEIWQYAVAEWDPQQRTWVDRAVAPVRPAARARFAAAFDRQRGRTLMFGGAGAASYGDTWEWDGTSNTWTRLEDLVNPQMRAHAGMAYDPDRDRVVLFGGYDPASGADPKRPFKDTWEFDGHRWISRGSPMPPLLDPSMLYHPGRRRIVVLGSEEYYGALRHMWEWDGTSWTVHPDGPPPATLFLSSACYDAKRQCNVVVGWDEATRRGATWEHDGTGWSDRTSVYQPSAALGMAYDPSRGMTIVWEGYLSYATWHWDGGTWVSDGGDRELLPRSLVYDSARGAVIGLAPDFSAYEWRGGWFGSARQPDWPARRSYTQVAYDSLRERVLVFGGHMPAGGPGIGFDDTWALRPMHPATYGTFGTGCHGTARPPALAASNRPWIGEILHLELTQLPARQNGALAVGLSDQSWNGVPLPLDLSPLGMTGCTLHVSVEATVPFATGDGSTVVSVPLGRDPGIRGIPFYNQAFVLDPQANPLGIAMTNAGRGVLGTGF
jgi:hypothetical protein